MVQKNLEKITLLFWVKNMSHFTTYLTELTNVTEQQIKDAVAQMAKMTNSKLITSIHNAYEQSNQKVLIGLTNEEIPQGIGVRVENKKLIICGDPYGQRAGFTKMQNLITQFGKLQRVQMNARANKIPYSLKLTKKELVMELC